MTVEKKQFYDSIKTGFMPGTINQKIPVHPFRSLFGTHGTLLLRKPVPKGTYSAGTFQYRPRGTGSDQENQAVQPRTKRGIKKTACIIVVNDCGQEAEIRFRYRGGLLKLEKLSSTLLYVVEGKTARVKTLAILSSDTLRD